MLFIYIVYIHINWVLFMNWNFGAIAPKCDDGTISITVKNHGTPWKSNWDDMKVPIFSIGMSIK